MAKQNLGMVTAYAYAVVGGYEGTEAEFEALLGNIATDLAEIENLTVIANTLPSGSSATASYDHGVLTLGIPKGDKGDTGAGATVTVGTTATGNPGTNASVINSGTTKDAVFNFTIPRGDTGNGIESIELTDTQGAVKTYTILFTDGNTTTFDVTDGEVTNATLTAVLADYAKIDGAYESMTVGNAEQLVSSIFEEDSVPYNFRTSGGSIDIGDRETDMLVGGTVAWNQLLQPKANTVMGVTITVSNGKYTLNGTVSSSGGGRTGDLSDPRPNIVSGHKYLLRTTLDTSGISAFFLNLASNASTYFNFGKGNTIVSASFTGEAIFGANFVANAEVNTSGYIQLFDLTAMFGTTIADYIYNLEQATAGAGVAWFKKLFPKPYYAYNAGELMSVQASSHDMVGFNQWDEEWELGGINTSGVPYSDNSVIRTKNYIPILPQTTYCWGKSLYAEHSSEAVGILVRYYDKDKNFISAETIIYTNWGESNFIKTSPQNAYYAKFMLSSTYGTTYNNDICINLSWDGERDGEYEAYVKHSYPLDSSLTLRGIPKLDASNNLYYDGDTYESDGTVTRKYGIVDLGTLTYTVSSSDTFYAIISDKMNGYGNIMCAKYVTASQAGVGNMQDKQVVGENGGKAVYVKDSALSGYTTAQVKTAMNGVYLVYELATPTTETADPYTNPQIVDDFGTEEYVDYAVSQGDRDVSIPVGHYTQYMANLKAKLEMSPNSPEGAGDYIVRQTNGENEYVSLASNATIQDIIARLEALEGGGE